MADSIDPLVPKLRLAFDIVLPAATVAFALTLGHRGDTTSGSLFGDIVTAEDVEEERAKDRKPVDLPASDAPSENSPLIGHKYHASRSLKSWLYVFIGAYELVLHSALLIGGLPRGVHVAQESFAVAIWSFATLKPLFSPSRSPPYSLFTLYILALITTGFDVYIASASGKSLVDILQLIHVAACMTGLALCLNTPLRPGLSGDEDRPIDTILAMDEYATLGQYLSVSWMNLLMERARSGALHDTDVFRLVADSRANVLTRRFKAFMSGHKLLRRIAYANLGTIVVTLTSVAASGALMSIQPALIRRILVAIEEPTAASGDSAISLEPQLSILGLAFAPIETAKRDNRTAYLFACLATLGYLAMTHFDIVFGMMNQRFATRARAMTIGTIYRKALVRIDTSGIVSEGKETHAADMGRLAQLISADAGQIVNLPVILDAVVQGPINVLILGWFLYDVLGISAFVGYVMFFVVGPFTSWSMKRFMQLYADVAKRRDARTRSINELLQSVKFIKFSGWETQWSARIHALREKELQEVFVMRVFMELSNATWTIVPIFISCISIAWYTLVVGHQLTVSVAFPAIIALGSLAFELNNAPSKLSSWSSLVAAFRRIDEFLEEDEVPAWTSTLKDDTNLEPPHQPFDLRIGTADANFRWHRYTPKPEDGDETEAPKTPWYKRPLAWLRQSSTANEPTEASATAATSNQSPFQLRNINVIFPKGGLSLIIGPTGSGKSSLLAALLGEMECTSGQVLLPKGGHRVNPETGLVEGVSFCSQLPWLESKTIRENILFGSSYDDKRYKDVLEACCLLPDLAIMDNGDETEIGDKGLVLSGGQKARVALARAVYSRTQTVLLDDVLSAVDIHTAATLISKCIYGPIMQGRTIILVTHHFSSVIHGAAWVVQMHNGIIKIQGSPEDLRKGGDLADITRSTVIEKEDGLVVDKEGSGVGEPGPTGPSEKKGSKLVEDETKSTGNVRGQVYATYLRAASYWVVAIVVVAILVREFSNLSQKLWIKAWAESYDRPDGWRNFLNFRSAADNALPYVLVYLGLQLSTVLLIVGVSFPAIWSTLRASRLLFNNMLESVMRSPPRFFDKNPSGRILNRFTQDIGNVDGGVGGTMRRVGGMALKFAVAIGTVVYGVPPFIVVLVPLVWLHLYVARGYITAGRDLVRIQSTTNSPVYTLFSEVIRGLTTIRAFGGEVRFSERMHTLLDRYHWTMYCHEAADSWLSYRFGILAAATFGTSALLSIRLGLSPGLVAIVLTQAESILGELRYALSLYVSLENSMNAVERVQEYIDLPAEPPRRVPGVPAAWPFLDQGITFKDVVLRYAPDLDPVLRGISFHVKAGEKIGIVGRTGSGKSTLAMSLFRFVDPDEGTISVGGMDITKVGVQDLREHLTLIPQDAALYGGTIRENLDPFNEHTDAECIDALRMVQLPIEASSGSATPSAEGAETTGETGSATQTIVTLESKVSDGGANWSAGQRQLIAMARALLRNSGIVVLDESTASVDFETDKKIQKTIRERFIGSILLTIAHRLHTIIDYDRILVLDHGKVVEFDTPAALVGKEGGVFRGMCEQSGHFAELRNAAEGKMLVVV